MAKWITEPAREQERPKTGKRYPLLLYQQFNEANFWWAIMIVAISAALLIWNPDRLEPYRLPLAIVLAGVGLVLVLIFLFRLAAYVQCSPTGLRLRTPLHRILIPYEEIRLTRPTLLYELFPPNRQRWTQRAFLGPLWSKTVVVVEMDKLPRPAAWLRLWIGKYMVCPDAVGLAVLVGDWMGLRAELDEFIIWRRRTRTRP
jgi:hypothetical protein